MSGSSWTAITLAALGLALMPLLATPNVALDFMTYTGIIAVAAQGWNILAGYGGQFSFGHAVFFGVGAYAMVLLQVRFGINAWLALPGAIALSGLVGAVLGFLSFRARLRGSYFALVTIAFAEVFRISANAWGFAGGAAGVLVPLKIDAWNMQFAEKRALYWLVLAFVVAGLAITHALARSRFGAQLVAVRENEDAARALGVDTLKVKLGAIVISAMLTAAAGCLYALKFLYVDSQIAFGPWISIDALLAPIIGGRGTVFGPLIGAASLLGLGEVTKIGLSKYLGVTAPGIDLVFYGIILIIAVAYAPRGILGPLVSIGRAARGSGRTEA